MPPVGVAGWSKEYRLEREWLMDVVVAFGAALGLHRPVYMGSSVGGHWRPTSPLPARALPPAASRALAEDIKGTTFTEMDGLGHVPMSEDPDRFLGYIRPVLAGIRERLG